MKQLLIYGDSNTYGIRAFRIRYREQTRWVTQLQELLKDEWHIIPNGVAGKVAGDFRTDKPHKNGQRHYKEALLKAGNVDMVIIALGTNDLQQRFHRTPDEIVADLAWYKAASGDTPILYLLPTHFERVPEFTNESEQKLNKLIPLCQKTLGHCIVLGEIGLSDGLHFSPNGHKRVAETVAAAIQQFTKRSRT